MIKILNSTMRNNSIKKMVNNSKNKRTYKKMMLNKMVIKKEISRITSSVLQSSMEISKFLKMKRVVRTSMNNFKMINNLIRSSKTPTKKNSKTPSKRSAETMTTAIRREIRKAASKAKESKRSSQKETKKVSRRARPTKEDDFQVLLSSLYSKITLVNFLQVVLSPMLDSTPIKPMLKVRLILVFRLLSIG